LNVSVWDLALRTPGYQFSLDFNSLNAAPTRIYLLFAARTLTQVEVGTTLGQRPRHSSVHNRAIGNASSISFAPKIINVDDPIMIVAQRRSLSPNLLFSRSDRRHVNEIKLRLNGNGQNGETPVALKLGHRAYGASQFHLIVDPRGAHAQVALANQFAPTRRQTRFAFRI
jgi:hypothetical protein